MTHDPGVEHEPQFRGSEPTPDPREGVVEQRLRREWTGRDADDDADLHSVFDEPALAGSVSAAAAGAVGWRCRRCGYDLRGLPMARPCPECGATERAAAAATAAVPGYARWLQRRMARTSSASTWWTVAVLAVVGGPWAVLGALWSSGGPLLLVVVGPTVEEVMKVAAVAVVVETMPYRFRRASQIAIAAIAAAFVFAVIENVLYLNVYISNPTPLIIGWRWTVCVALHTGCTAMVAVGLMQVWRDAIAQMRRPALSRSLPWLAAGIVMHGTYNALAVVLEFAGFFG